MADLDYGLDELRWGSDNLIWGTAPAAIVAGVEAIAHWALEASYPEDGEDILVWTGVGTLTKGGKNYVGIGPQFLTISETEASYQTQDGRVQVSFGTIDTDLITKFLKDPGAVSVKLNIVVSTDGGTTWTFLPRSVRGWLSSPSIKAGIYTFEIATDASDIDRGRPLMWSNENQQRRHPGDLGFSHLQALGSGVEIRWPPFD